MADYLVIATGLPRSTLPLLAPNRDDGDPENDGRQASCGTAITATRVGSVA
jgi:hypothetical protein